jgi:hypothetical protein
MNPNVIPLQAGQDECLLVKATVKGVSKQSLMIELSGSVMSARTAFSCLVSPMVGDTVLVNQNFDDYHVLAVLERSAEQDMSLNFPANVKMVATDGQLDLVSGQDINLLSTSNTRMVSGNIKMTAAAMNIKTNDLTAHISEIESHSKSVKLFTDVLSTVGEQIT